MILWRKEDLFWEQSWPYQEGKKACHDPCKAVQAACLVEIVDKKLCAATSYMIEKAEGLWCVLVAVMAEGEVLVGSFVKFGTAAQIPLLSEGGVTLLQCNTVTL